MTKLLTPDEVASMLQVEKSTIYAWTHTKQIPYLKVGRLVRFEPQTIQEWLTERREAVHEINTDLIRKKLRRVR